MSDRLQANAQIVSRYYRHEPNLLEAAPPKKQDSIAWSETSLPKGQLREGLGNFPDASEVEVVRHFTRLSMRNYSVDEGLYPLGSCTMKYNPRINETVANFPGFRNVHPMQDETQVQGALELLYELQKALCAITGLDAVTLQSAAGAQGEFVGIKAICAYHQDKGEKRSKVLIPDSAHGTNAASTVLCGLKSVSLNSNTDGIVTAESVAAQMNDDVAAIMITIPNTLGIFEKEIKKIADIIHEKGGLVYCDGANLNSVMCRVDFKAMGVDVMHINLHKTMSTPHGGGGPGAGPVVARDILEPFLPSPVVEHEQGKYFLKNRGEKSIGRVKPYFGSFGILVRAFAYIIAHGGEGLRDVSGHAVLNANYLRKKLSPFFDLPFSGPSLHEVVFSDKKQKEYGVTAMDIGKRLLDYGFHPPTVYFPLIVKGALMMEPTETVSVPELDRFVATLKKITEEAETQPELVQQAPHVLGMRRLDEASAARKPELTWDEHWREN